LSGHDVIDDLTRRLINALEISPRILAIAVNPMLLSLMCLVHLNRQILPRGRSLLYSQCLDFLIDAWEREKARGFLVAPSSLSPNQKENLLRHIAFEMHMSGKSELPRVDLELLVENVARRLSITVAARELIDDIEKRSGLFVERSIDVLGFSHLTFQEYLSAKHVQLNPSLFPSLVLNLDHQEWLEVILLYSGLVDDASDLVRGIITDQSLPHVILAGRCIGEAQSVQRPLVQQITSLLWPGLVGEQGCSTLYTTELIG
jgi:predicted NACHT family NTPase